MALFYKARQSTAKSKDGTKKWFPCLIKPGKPVGTRELAEHISRQSSLTPGDVYNVIYNLGDVMQKHLSDGRSIRIEGLGTFTAIAHADGNGVDTAEEVNHKQINRLSMHFTPSYTRKLGGGITYKLFSGVQFFKKL